MKTFQLLAALAMIAFPLGAQQPQGQAPMCSASKPAAPAPHDMTPGSGGCPMMQGGGCPMMQKGHEGHGQHGQHGAAAGQGAEPALAPVWEAMTFCPSRLLEQKESLELTAQQEAKLEQLLESAQRSIEAAQANAQSESDALARALHADEPDVREVERRFGLLHAALGNAHLIRLRTSIQARAVLTSEQREKVVGRLALRPEHRP